MTLNTEFGWQGEQYQATKDLPLKEIAKRIKNEISLKHSDITVSVSTDFFSNGCAVNIRIAKVPFLIYRKVSDPVTHYPMLQYTESAKKLMDDVQRIADQYRRDNSDGQVDYYDTNFYCTPSFNWELMNEAKKKLDEEEKKS